MPLPPNLVKAELREIEWNRNGDVRQLEKVVKVQFNPETLKVTFSNQKSGGDQRGGSAIQFVGKGTTKLSLDLWFDVTVPGIDPNIQPNGDVRRVTHEVAYFITPKRRERDNQYIPPGIRFVWGTFLFEGVMDSMDETLEYFSENGRPLRARVTISVSQQEIQFKFEENPPQGSSASGAGGETPGTQPHQAARQGDSVQKAAARSGNQQNWRGIAEANQIENPRRLPPGTLLDVNPRR